MKIGKLYGVGIGPGDPAYLTLRAADVLRIVDVVFTVVSPHAAYSISRAVVESVKPQGDIHTLTFSMSRDTAVRKAQVRANAESVAAVLRAGQDCAFATLGDAMTYSTFGYVLAILKEEFVDLDVEVVPGITSFAALSAKACQVLVENGQMLRVIPSFRTEQVDNVTFPQGSTTVLLKTYRCREALIERLAREQAQDPGLEVLYGERIGLDGQYLSKNIAAMEHRDPEYLSMLVVKKPLVKKQ